ncbi:hypothetical protein FA09DRAFT_46821 [Tilletiopsis washingtonensis]|uniref:Uncharacterized protein n=1 Tax=Tilletiopsis washingtonensis TaxID=58919 RepID=A0A316Z9T5_9BASI|nr:hypothetical protein FA09DRAFT_46821 [Tilletiopsis washingtonensis]PWN97774.1 hypothetical protein FA09DRAFT_46821 [Tilletiopsis washingtonensis]
MRGTLSMSTDATGGCGESEACGGVRQPQTMRRCRAGGPSGRGGAAKRSVARSPRHAPGGEPRTCRVRRRWTTGAAQPASSRRRTPSCPWSCGTRARQGRRALRCGVVSVRCSARCGLGAECKRGLEAVTKPEREQASAAGWKRSRSAGSMVKSAQP